MQSTYLNDVHFNLIELDTNKPGHRQKKHICPACGDKRKTYVRYINSETLEYLPYEYGRCDREEKCAYFNKPNAEYYQDGNPFKKYPQKRATYKPTKPTKQQTIKPSFIDHVVVSKSLKDYEHNIFVQCLVNTFGATWAYQAVKDYLIGTSKYWPGSTIFWQVDKECKVRTGKIMLFKPDMHRTGKNETYAHSVLKLKNFNLSQCLFFEHLLIDADPNAIISIVEAQKTAVVASYFFPQYVWLASGGLDMLNAAKCQVLKGRTVIFFPDLSDKARKKWKSISKQINKQYGIKAIVSNYLDHINDGSDIADHLLQMPIDKQFGNVLNTYGYPAFWDS